MKTGKSLVSLAQELERQLQTKKDFIADTRSATMVIKNEKPLLQLDKVGSFGITDLCHNQIAERTGIPTKYYQMMLANAPLLLMRNVNHWFDNKSEQRMIRTLDGNARAFLSDRYRPLDNFDLCEVVLPKIQKLGCEVMSCDITEQRLYLKVVTQRIQAEVSKGDIVQAGLVISNSEVGCGSVKVEPLIYRLVCTNGMIANDYGMKKYHIGRGNGGDEIEGASEFYRTETRIADDKAFWLKVRDVVDATLEKVTFDKIVNKMIASKDLKIETNPQDVVEVVAKRMSLNEGESGSVLLHLINGGDLSAYGLANAFTRTSQDIPDYERATDFERFGGQIINISGNEWKQLQEVA